MEVRAVEEQLGVRAATAHTTGQNSHNTHRIRVCWVAVLVRASLPVVVRPVALLLE